ARVELGARCGERRTGGLERRRPLGGRQRPAGGGRRVQPADAAERPAGRGGETVEGAHQDSSERPSAATINAVDVAPGSWWPTERSPRYDARPLRACIGTVARAPSSAAAAAVAIATPRSSPRSTP